MLDQPSAKSDRDGQWHTRPGWAAELRLSIDGEGAQSWSDTEEHGLKTHLSEMAVQLITAGELNYRASARSSRERTLQRRRELDASVSIWSSNGRDQIGPQPKIVWLALLNHC